MTALNFGFKALRNFKFRPFKGRGKALFYSNLG
ncbi:MAG: hypothetical protein ACI9DJ_002826, partial [Algoriphagus sp.]